MNYSYVINRLLISMVLILIVISATYYVHTSTYYMNKIESPSTSICDSIYTSIDRNTTYALQGMSKSDDRVDKWYYAKGCDNVLIYVRLMKPLTNTTKGIILIHDYDSNYLSILGLALELVSKNYIVLLIDLSLGGFSKVKVLSTNYSISWIYLAVCNVIKILTLLEGEESNVTNIGLIGIGFGGVAALITAKYDNRVNYAVSIAGLGNYERSARIGGLINYYVKSINDMNPCLDSIYLIQNIDKKILILIGTSDEVNPIDPAVIDKLINNSNIHISIVPNANRFRIPSEWRYIVYSFLENIDKHRFSRKDTKVIVDKFEIIVYNSASRDIVVLEKPMYFSSFWKQSVLNDRVRRFTYFIIPGEYIVVDKEYFSVYGYYTTSGDYGFVLAIILFIIWIIINRERVIYYLKNISKIHILYTVSIVLTLFYIYYPTLLFFNRFHISLYIAAEIYSMLFPFLYYLIIITPIAQTLTLTFLYNTKKRRGLFYVIFIDIPLFTLVFTYLFLLLIGTRLYHMIWGIPTFSIIPLASTTILHYIVTSKTE